MPRKARGNAEAQRKRQERYRQRLRSSGTPEASAVDVAVSATVSALAEAVRREGEEARVAAAQRREALRARLEDDDVDEGEAGDILAELMLPPAVAEREPLDPADYVRRLLRGAVSLLVSRGYDPAHARRMVIRRLGRGGDLTQLDELILASGISLSRRASRGYAP